MSYRLVLYRTVRAVLLRVPISSQESSTSLSREFWLVYHAVANVESRGRQKLSSNPPKPPKGFLCCTLEMLGIPGHVTAKQHPSQFCLPKIS